MALRGALVLAVVAAVCQIRPLLAPLRNTIRYNNRMLSAPVLCDSNLSLYLSALAISDNGALIFNYAVSVAKSHSTSVNDLFMQILMRREFCQHGTFPVHVDLAGCRSHLDARHRRGVPIRSSRLPELFRGYNHHQPGYETDSVFEFVPCQKIKPWGSAMYLYIALSTWLPLLFISIGNLLLIIRMRKSYKIHNELTHNFRYRSSRTHNSSRTLLAVAIVHLILLLPLGIVETLELYWDVILIKYPAKNAGENERYIHWLQEKMLLKWCRGLFFHIYHWNFAINFFLYYLTGKKFRSVVTQTLKSYTDTYLPCHKNVLRCNTWSNCHKHLRSSSVLLMRAVMRSKQFNDMARGSASERSSNVT
ncbi:uncharacterized protein LOC105431310 isoform X5 [Pogonomyrmex barbatus]|uniref:Uncharacterized protein LOC105431310 isoform X5 n=1 Tax=Pogonomyrmex barbatus TaxID=144034 RepID=A0A8N1SAK8_9HYME|nr:uncharacterized protein LOC105431310 isoform X5 [Pogonomyrmex barbatus]